MNKEEKEAIDILQNCIADYVIGDYCEKCGDRLICEDRNEDCYFQQAIDIVLNLIQKQDKIIESYKEILKWSSRERKNNTMDYVKVNKKNKFGTNGICQDMRTFKRTGKIKYRAYITFQGKQYSLGSHDSLEEAKKARTNAEEKIKCIKEYLKKEVEKDVED